MSLLYIYDQTGTSDNVCSRLPVKKRTKCAPAFLLDSPLTYDKQKKRVSAHSLYVWWSRDQISMYIWYVSLVQNTSFLFAENRATAVRQSIVMSLLAWEGIYLVQQLGLKNTLLIGFDPWRSHITLMGFFFVFTRIYFPLCRFQITRANLKENPLQNWGLLVSIYAI